MTITEWGNIPIFASDNDREVPMAEKRISHEGVVDSMSGSNVKVIITSDAACDQCHAKAACQVSGGKEKFIEVHRPSGEFRAGEKVKIVLAQSSGFRAMFLGYLLPFLLVFSMLLLLTAIGTGEGLAGLGALAVLPPYYLILHMLRDRLARRFDFILHKI